MIRYCYALEGVNIRVGLYQLGGDQSSLCRALNPAAKGKVFWEPRRFYYKRKPPPMVVFHQRARWWWSGLCPYFLAVTNVYRWNENPGSNYFHTPPEDIQKAHNLVFPQTGNQAHHWNSFFFLKLSSNFNICLLVWVSTLFMGKWRKNWAQGL